MAQPKYERCYDLVNCRYPARVRLIPWDGINLVLEVAPVFIECRNLNDTSSFEQISNT